MTKFEFEAIGTTWKIDIENNLSKDEEVILKNKIIERIYEFDKNYSRFRADSLVTKMSKVSGIFEMPDDADGMISLYKSFYIITNGLVTPLIGKVLVDAGYDEKYSFETKPLTSPKTWDNIIKWNNPKLTLSEPTLLDFGAGGKGYLVDIVGELLEGRNIESYCVDAGGDMRHRNAIKKTLRIGLEHPEDMTNVIGIVVLGNESLCGSAGSRRKWEDFHHIINPISLTSPKEVIAVWCIAKTTLLADLLTTALFFTKPEVLLKHFEFEYLVLNLDYSILKSEGFNAEIFTS